MEIDVSIDNWPGEQWEALAAQAALSTRAIVSELANPRLQVSVLFTSDARVHALNHEWRGRDHATNVLSFPMLLRSQVLDLASDGPLIMLGDIALARQTCMQEAKAKDISLADHVAHLIVHGLLHLAGYDHETGDVQAGEMEALEVRILAKMGIADPYSGDQPVNEPR